MIVYNVHKVEKQTKHDGERCGMPMADVNSASVQPFKFGGKELEREGGMDFYDFEARRLDFALGRFPYAYCAADPVNFIDPTGMTIYVNGTLYTIGMEYKGDNSFTRQIITALNLIAEKGGKKLLQALRTSSKQYNYVQSKNGQTFATPTENTSGEYTGTNMYIATDGHDEITVAGSVAHESMHAAQYEHGVGGPYIINEVEAYGFEDFIRGNIPAPFSNALLPSDTSDNLINRLHSYAAIMYADEIERGFMLNIYEYTLNWFFYRSRAYNSSFYSKYKQWFPIKRHSSLYRYYTNR